MTIETDLMKLLASGTRRVGPANAPGGSGATPGSPGLAAGEVDFSSLLDQARRGDLRTGLPVTVAHGLNLTLTDNQLARLSAAADQAEAAGANRALVLMDGTAFTLDVGVRQVTGTADVQSGKAVAGVDAVIQVPSPAGASGGGAAGSGMAQGGTSPGIGLVPGSDAGVTSKLNTSLLRALGARANTGASSV